MPVQQYALIWAVLYNGIRMKKHLIVRAMDHVLPVREKL